MINHRVGVPLRPVDDGADAAFLETENRLDDPDYCGSCYGAHQKSSQCCNTCDEVRDAYKVKGWILTDLTAIEQCLWSGQTAEAFQASLDANEGCKAKGSLTVSKLSGSVHFSPAPEFSLAHNHGNNQAAFDQGVFDSSHIIHRFSYGEEFPGLVNPLSGVVNKNDGVHAPNVLYNYHAKVVPTQYNYISGQTIDTNQYVSQTLKTFIKNTLKPVLAQE